MEKRNFWDLARYCRDTYGSYYDTREHFFICSECQEPLYYEDWTDYDNWPVCPICETNLMEIE